MTDQNPHAAKGRECFIQQAAGVGVQMIGRFVQGQNRWFAPQCNGNLGPFAFPVAESVPSLHPIIPDPQSILDPECGTVLCVHHVAQMPGTVSVRCSQ